MKTDSHIYSIDSLRFVAVFGVICLHFHPFETISYPISVLIEQLMYFAIPFFFITSGYLFRKKIVDEGKISGRYSKFIKRLAIVFFAWSFIYLFVPETPLILTQAKSQGLIGGLHMVFDINLDKIAAEPLYLFMAGTSAHLWYLFALAMTISLLFLFIKLGIEDMFLFIAIPMYIFRVLVGPYSVTPLGIQIDFVYYLGPFLAAVFVGIGALIAKKDFKPSRQTAVMVILFGLGFQIAEWYLLHRIYGWDQHRHAGFSLGTVVYGTGIFLLALSMPAMGKSTGFFRLGQFALGIYLIHMIFVPVAHKFYGDVPKPLGELGPFAILAASLLLTVFLMQLPYLRKIVI